MAQSPSLNSAQFARLFTRLAAVNVLSNLMVPLAGLIDVAFLGHLSEIRHLAGVALANVLFNYLYWSFGFLRMGTTGTTAQAMGRQDREAVLLIGLRHGLLALGIGCLLVLLQQPLRLLGFWLLSATPEVKAAGEAFYSALIWGAPANLLGFVLVGWFLGRAQSGYVLILSLLVSLANVGFDYLLIVRWGLGSWGAGAATAISQTLMALVGLGLVSREVSWSQVRAAAPNLLDWPALRSALSLNRDILIRTLSLVTTFALFTNLSSGLGTVTLASNTLLLQAVSFAAYFIDGIAFATESLAGRLQGQGTGGLRQLLRLAGSTSLVLGLLFGLGLILEPRCFQLLTSHSDVLDQVQRYAPWLLPLMGFGSLAYMLDGYFLGLTQGQTLRRSTLIATLAGFAPVAVLAWWQQSADLLWLSLTLFMALRAVTLAVEVPGTLKQ